MEERKLIYRSQNPNDGRSILVQLTPFGIDKREDSKQVVLHFNSEIEKNLSLKKIKYFFETLNCIKAIAQEFEHFTPPILKAI